MLATADDLCDPHRVGDFARQALLLELVEAILDGDRLLVLTGPQGTGKSTIATAVEHELTTRSWRVLRVGQCDDRFISLRAFACQLLHKPTSEFLDEDIERLFALMTTRDTSNGKVLIIVDNADRLSADLREYLGLLCSVAVQMMPQLLFIGAPSFWETGRAPMRPADFRNHVSRRLYLEPLANSEVQESVTPAPADDAVVAEEHPQTPTDAAVVSAVPRPDDSTLDPLSPSTSLQPADPARAMASVSVIPPHRRPEGVARRIWPVVAVTAVVVASAPIYWMMAGHNTGLLPIAFVRSAMMTSGTVQSAEDAAAPAALPPTVDPRATVGAKDVSGREQISSQPAEDSARNLPAAQPGTPPESETHEPPQAGPSPAVEHAPEASQPATPPTVSAGADAGTSDASADVAPNPPAPQEPEQPVAVSDAEDSGGVELTHSVGAVQAVPQEGKDRHADTETPAVVEPMHADSSPLPASGGDSASVALAPEPEATAAVAAGASPPLDSAQARETGRVAQIEPRGGASVSDGATGPISDPGPAPAASPGPQAVARTDALALLSRGDAMLAVGDVSAARLLYRRAASFGNARAATALGKTYDPAFLALAQVTGIAADAALAAEWYRKGIALGDSEAINRLAGLPSSAEGNR